MYYTACIAFITVRTVWVPFLTNSIFYAFNLVIYSSWNEVWTWHYSSIVNEQITYWTNHTWRLFCSDLQQPAASLFTCSNICAEKVKKGGKSSSRGGEIDAHSHADDTAPGTMWGSIQIIVITLTGNRKRDKLVCNLGFKIELAECAVTCCTRPDLSVSGSHLIG